MGEPLRRRGLLVGGITLAAGLAVAAYRASGPALARPQGAAGERVVSLSPSTTEAMFAIGAGDLLVGRTSACNVPKEALALPVVGGFGTPNVEVILSLAPTAIVGSRGPAGPVLLERLASHGVQVLLPPTSSLPDVAAMLQLLGERFGRQQQADVLVAAMAARIAQLSAWAQAREVVSALLVFDANPTYVAGPGSFPSELLRLAGARNVIAAGGPYPVVDVEQLLELDPHIIIDAIAPGELRPSALPRQPGWWVLPAVKRQRVVRLRSDAALRPGPRLADGLADLVELLHGAVPA